MSDMDKILRETEKAVHLEYELLSGLEPGERKDRFAERLHGTHLTLLTVNQVLTGDKPEEYKASCEKIREFIDDLMEENAEKFREATQQMYGEGDE